MIEVIRKFNIMNENSKRDFVLDYVASNDPISRQGGTKRRTPLTIKFETLDVCQNAWFKCHGIKKGALFNYRKHLSRWQFKGSK